MSKDLLIAFLFTSAFWCSVGDAQGIGPQPQPGMQPGRDNLPTVFFVQSVEVAQFAKDTGDPSGEYSGAVHVWVEVRNSATPESAHVTLTPIYPPAVKGITKSSTATLDLLASATPATSDVCAFSVMEAVFIFHSKLPLGVVRIRSANNVISLSGPGRKSVVFKKPDCAGIIGTKIANLTAPVTLGQGSGQIIRVVRAVDPVGDITVNPNRMSLYLDDSDNVSAVLWQ